MINILFNFGNLTDWLQVSFAFVVMICTIIMAYYAKQALNTWRVQYKHTVIIKLIENVEVMRELFLHIRNRYDKVLSNEEQAAYKDHRVETSINIKRKWEKSRNQFEELTKLNLNCITTLDSQNKLRNYYSFLHNTLSNIKNNIPYYEHFAVTLVDLRGSINKLEPEIKKIYKLKTSEINIELNYSNYESYATLIEEKEKELEDYREGYKNILKKTNEIEKLLFTHLFDINKDSIVLEFQRLHEEANNFIANYNSDKVKHL